MIKPYIVLRGQNFYPTGWGDFAGSADTIEEARAIATKDAADEHIGWWEIVDLRTMEVAESWPE